MEEKNNINDVLTQVKEVDEGINNMIIPLLKDTIKDSNKYNKRLFTIAIVELCILLITIIVGMYLIYKQNIKYQEFLSQFDFETETIYQQILEANKWRNLL